MSNVIRLRSGRAGKESSERKIEPSGLNAPALKNETPSSSDTESLRSELSPQTLPLRKSSESPSFALRLGLRSGDWREKESMLDQLDRRDRLRLVEFVCSFAWADLEIQPEERVFVSRLIRRLDLSEEEDLQVQQWLDRPPQIDDLDPTSIPEAHRLVFVDAIEGIIEADGEVSEEERDSFEIFKQLLGS